MKTQNKQKSDRSLLADLFKKISQKLRIQLHLEPEWGFVGQLVYPNGIKRYFRGTTLDINTMGASEIARDKDYAKFFMQSMGYPVIPGGKFYSKSWAEKIGSDQTIEKAWEYAKPLGLPVFLKPNSKSQGAGVTQVYSRKEFFKSFRAIAKIDNVVLVEKTIVGKDYRIVVLDDQVISVYQRIPLSITGDGVSTIVDLLNQKQEEFLKAGRDKTFLLEDVRLKMTLTRMKLTAESVLPAGEQVQLLANANLSTGGTSLDVTNKIHSHFQKIAVSLTKDMGLRLCGVDIMIANGGDITSPNDYFIIEINSAPGLDHYASLGKKQEKIVEDLYTQVLTAMGKK